MRTECKTLQTCPSRDILDYDGMKQQILTFFKVFLLEKLLNWMNWSSKWSFDLNLSLTDITVVRYVPRQNPFFPLWEIIIKSYFLIYHSIYNFRFFSFFSFLFLSFLFFLEKKIRMKKKFQENFFFHSVSENSPKKKFTGKKCGFVSHMKICFSFNQNFFFYSI